MAVGGCSPWPRRGREGLLDVLVRIRRYGSSGQAKTGPPRGQELRTTVVTVPRDGEKFIQRLQVPEKVVVQVLLRLIPIFALTRFGPP